MLNKYWFKPKHFGIGATPSSWEGWLVTFGLVVVVVLRAKMLVNGNIRGFLFELMFAILVFVILARYKTEGEWEWRWGLSK